MGKGERVPAELAVPLQGPNLAMQMKKAQVVFFDCTVSRVGPLFLDDWRDGSACAAKAPRAPSPEDLKVHRAIRFGVGDEKRFGVGRYVGADE